MSLIVVCAVFLSGPVVVRLEVLPRPDAIQALFGLLFAQSDILQSFPKFEGWMRRFHDASVKDQRFAPTPMIVEWRIELAGQYHVALLGDTKPSQYTPQHAATILQPLCIMLAAFVHARERYKYVLHKLAYMHVFYAITMIAQHQQAMTIGRPYDARGVAAEVAAKSGNTVSSPRELAHTFSFTAVPDPVYIGQVCQSFDVRTLLRYLMSTFVMCGIAPLPHFFTFCFNYILPTVHLQKEGREVLERLYDHLILTLDATYVSQGMLTPVSQVDKAICEWTTQIVPTPTSFPHAAHPLHARMTRQMRLATFHYFYRTRGAHARHRSRACTLEEHQRKQLQLGRVNPGHTGVASLKELGFMLHDINSLRLRQSPVKGSTNSDGEIDGASVGRVTDLLSSLKEPPSLPARLMAYSTFMQFFHLLHARLPPDAQHTPHRPIHSRVSAPLFDPCVVELVTVAVDRARLFNVLDYVLCGGEVGERVMALLLHVQATRHTAITLFNQYRTNLRREEEAGTQPVDAQSRQLYRPVLVYLAQQNQREAFDNINAELEATGVNNNTHT
jgi:hypothetical protein